MKKIIAYHLVTGETAVYLNSYISDYMNAGYQPYGLPFFSGMYYAQAMVKYED